jgi:hypothetical protein
MRGWFQRTLHSIPVQVSVQPCCERFDGRSSEPPLYEGHTCIAQSLHRRAAQIQTLSVVPWLMPFVEGVRCMCQGLLSPEASLERCGSCLIECVA